MSRDAWEHDYTHGHHAHQHDAPWHAPELEAFLDSLSALPRVALDLGCGTGGDAVHLAGRGVTSIGVDLSPTALERARERAAKHGVEVTWLEGSVLDLPLEDASVDFATDRGCLHHVPQEDHARYAREAARVLRPGGTLLVRELNVPGHHQHAVTEEQIRAMVTGTPFSIASIRHVELGSAHGATHATVYELTRNVS